MCHPLTPLARRRVCQIEYCRECDVLHVTVGPVTMRLEPAAAGQLRGTLGDALDRLESSVTVVEPVPGPLVN